MGGHQTAIRGASPHPCLIAVSQHQSTTVNTQSTDSQHDSQQARFCCKLTIRQEVLDFWPLTELNKYFYMIIMFLSRRAWLKFSFRMGFPHFQALVDCVLTVC